jgi:hypothetical protein
MIKSADFKWLGANEAQLIDRERYCCNLYPALLNIVSRKINSIQENFPGGAQYAGRAIGRACI